MGPRRTVRPFILRHLALSHRTSPTFSLVRGEATQNHAAAWTTRRPTPTANVPPEPMTSISARPMRAPRKRKKTEAARRSCKGNGRM